MAHIVDCLLDADLDAEQDDLPVDLALGLNNYIAKALSPQDPNESVCNHFSTPESRGPSPAVGQSSPVTPSQLGRASPSFGRASPSLGRASPSLGRASPSGDKPFAWRMQQPERKLYQLFPKDKPAATPPAKALDPEQAFALAMGQNGDKSEKPTAVTGLRIRIKEHNLIRRRKISVPELGPMTTVQEVSMDSRTSCRSLLSC